MNEEQRIKSEYNVVYIANYNLKVFPILLN
jgi:hypothetical protein